MEELYRITVRVSFPGFRISGIIFTSTISTSFSRDHSVCTPKCVVRVCSNVRTFTVCLPQKSRGRNGERGVGGGGGALALGNYTGGYGLPLSPVRHREPISPQALQTF